MSPKFPDNFRPPKCQFQPLIEANFEIFILSVKNCLWNWRSLIKIPNKYDFIWSSWINIAGYNQSQVIYLETNPITNVKLTHLFCLTPTLEYQKISSFTLKANFTFRANFTLKENFTHRANFTPRANLTIRAIFDPTFIHPIFIDQGYYFNLISSQFHPASHLNVSRFHP